MGGAIAEVAAIIMGGDGGMAIITVGRTVVIAVGIEAGKTRRQFQRGEIRGARPQDSLSSPSWGYFWALVRGDRKGLHKATPKQRLLT